MSSRSVSARDVTRYLVLVLLLTMPVWAVLTRPGLPATQVGPLPVLQLQAAEQEPPTYPVEVGSSWRGAGALHFKLARLMRMTGADALTAIKGSALLAILLLSAGVFAWARRLAGPRAGVLAAVLVVFSPVFLSTLFRSGDWPLLWVMAGLAWAGFGLMSSSRWGLALVAAGAFVATAAHPGLGLWALVGLMLLAVSIRRWLGIVALLVGAVIGVLLSSPWTGTAMSEVPARGAGFYQLIEPGWLWGVRTLSLDTPLSFSFGFALLALLILAIWSYFQRSEVGDQKSEVGGTNSQFAIRNPQFLWHLAIGIFFVFFSLEFVAQRLGSVSAIVSAPWHLLLLALPFLAVAAVSALRFIPRLQETPLWAGLLIIAILGAGPGLSPDFQTYDIPASPAAIFGDNQIVLLDLEPEGELQPGATIALNADWFSSQPVDFDYNIFIHVVDGDGKAVAQLDAQPQAGERPMTSWLPGEIISDRYELAIPADASSDLSLRLGLYNWQTGERMFVVEGDADDALELHQDKFK